MLPFAAMWMDLENILFSEINQRKINITWYHLYVEYIYMYIINTYSKTEPDVQI